MMRVARKPITAVLRYLVETFNGPTINSDWTGAGGTYSFKKKEFVSWAGKVNVTESANSTLTKSAGGVAWNAGAYSTQQVSSGYIKAQATINNNSGGGNSGVIIGISNVTDAQSSSDDSTIDFCLVAYNGTIYKQEDGSATSISTYVVGDIIGVEVTAGGNVNYIKNGVVISTHTSPTLNYPLCVDCSLRSTTGELGNCEVITSATPGTFMELSAGRISSVRTNLDITSTTVTIHSEINSDDWYLVLGDIAGNTYLIEIRYVPSLNKIRLTQHYAGLDHHTDYSYGSLSNVAYVQLKHIPGAGAFDGFNLLTSSDGITFTYRGNQNVDSSFVLTACGVDLPVTSGTARLENFDSNIRL